MKNWNPCFNVLYIALILHFFWVPKLNAQKQTYLKPIQLTDTLDYTSFYCDHQTNTEYPLSYLFDADFNTCWVLPGSVVKDTVTLYLKIPKEFNSTIRIYNGYGKNHALCQANGRIKSMTVSIHAALRPAGHVSETGNEYLTAKFSSNQKFEFPDSCGFFQFDPKVSHSELHEFLEKMKTSYHKFNNHPVVETCFILQIDFTDAWTGTRYSDICISEIAFHDRIWATTYKKNQIEKVYIENDHKLLIDKPNNKRIEVFQSDSCIVQLMQVSPDNNWAIIILMQNKKKGRSETVYYLINLVKNSIVNKEIKDITGHLPSINPMYFKIEDNKTYLQFESTLGEQETLELY